MIKIQNSLDSQQPPQTLRQKNRLMEDNEEKLKSIAEASSVTGPWSLAALYVKNYGRETGALITVLLLYQIMVAPAFERQQIETAIQREIIQEMNKVALILNDVSKDQRILSEQQKEHAEHLRATASILDKYLIESGRDK